MAVFDLSYVDIFGDEQNAVVEGGALAQKFGVPPFSVLDTKQGYWRNRSNAWKRKGIKSEVGRNDELTYKFAKDFKEKYGKEMSGTSIFDPVLCELMYSWFCPDGGQIVDPFTGGSVRGIVAGCMGYNYWGCDLRQEQIDENNSQKEEIKPAVYPKWICGDSRETVKTAPKADFIFSCPPYGDLEVYSDDPKDLSTLAYNDFIKDYALIIRNCVRCLKDDSFACFVVANFRDKKTGLYQNFVNDTIAAFTASGAFFYNDIILLNAIGTAAIRSAKTFNASRKVCKLHQNVLVFVKGDAKKASIKCNQELVVSENYE